MPKCPRYSQWDLLKTFDMFGPFFEHFLIFWHKFFFRFIFFLRSLGPFQWTVVLRSQDLGTRCNDCSLDPSTPRPSEWTELEVSTHTHIYRDAHTFTPVFLSLCISETMSSHRYFLFQSTTTTGFILVFLFPYL